eukprot:959757-Rhodomonas_salina.1
MAGSSSPSAVTIPKILLYDANSCACTPACQRAHPRVSVDETCRPVGARAHTHTHRHTHTHSSA